MKTMCLITENKKLISWVKKVEENLNGCKFYLVGSALTQYGPRDIDIYGRMDKMEFETLFGTTENWISQGRTGEWKNQRYVWSKICILLGEWAFRETGIRNLDIKILPDIVFDKYCKEKRKIK